MTPRIAIEPDAVHPGMWRVRLADGALSDLLNKTRAKDLARTILGTEPRAVARPARGRPFAKSARPGLDAPRSGHRTSTPRKRSSP